MLKNLTGQEFSAITDFKMEVNTRVLRAFPQDECRKYAAYDVLDILHNVWESYKDVLEVSQRLLAEDMQKSYESGIFEEITKPIKELV